GFKFSISTCDQNAFEIGKNLAVTPGSVIFQNKIMQIIQYAPQTKKTYSIPLLIVTAWINKYYILDLQKKNSMVNYLVELGYTVFIISWNNPQKEDAATSFEDYAMQGVLEAIKQVKLRTNAEKINCVGYCLGGTLLAASCAYLKSISDHSINSMTFLATLVDFEDAGDISLFIDEAQIANIERLMEKDGYLDGYYMSFAFKMLQSEDMIWSYYINNYLLGKTPPAFDILYWNEDYTRLPAKMHSYYLRNMYLDNNLVKQNKLEISNISIDLKSIDCPTYIVGAKKDHITPWKSVYKAMNIYQGENKFILSGSGHIAGIVNHPSRQKYEYFECESDNVDTWLENAKIHKGSWWPNWHEWLKCKSGKKIDAKEIDQSIEDAPGAYVFIK
ncbi:MAG: alpha/beta fold hydrolase, partial [Proteobacteria bacterium]|nr:alpha/beta fold hydrolase [Pseudomonadota bacterium]